MKLSELDENVRLEIKYLDSINTMKWNQEKKIAFVKKARHYELCKGIFPPDLPMCLSHAKRHFRKVIFSWHRAKNHIVAFGEIRDMAHDPWGMFWQGEKVIGWERSEKTEMAEGETLAKGVYWKTGYVYKFETWVCAPISIADCKAHNEDSSDLLKWGVPPDGVKYHVG